MGQGQTNKVWAVGGPFFVLIALLALAILFTCSPALAEQTDKGLPPQGLANQEADEDDEAAYRVCLGPRAPQPALAGEAAAAASRRLDALILDKFHLVRLSPAPLPGGRSDTEEERSCGYWADVEASVKRSEAESLLNELGIKYVQVENPTKEAHQRFLDAEQEAIARRSERDELDPANLFNHYHSHDRLHAFMEQLAARYPTITRLFSIGQSTRGQSLWGLEISRNPGVNELEPEVKYVANMHGDEVVGRELSLYFMHYLCTNYGQPGQERITTFVDNTDIFIIPTMNPDGFASGRRANGNGRDLNRDFPDQFQSGTHPFQPETEAVMQWSEQRYFSLSANFHGGSVVANYPYDGNHEVMSGRYSSCPDDDIFRHLALTYATHNPTMLNSREFTNGITNGAKWYVLYGGMQDWNYLTLGDFEITVELSDNKWPRDNQLRSFWDDNRESMLAYLEQVHTGVWGVVTDHAGNPLPAQVIVNHRPPVRADPAHGDYYRLLRPSFEDYTFTVSCAGYQTLTQVVHFPDTIQRLRVDFQLSPN